MTWKLKQSIKSLLSNESGWIKKDWGAKTSVALIYPNTYEIGMGNLAVHTIYELLNRCERIVCERAFLPNAKDMQEHLRSKTPILSLESQRPISDFDVIAFTISFENDYLGVLPILSASQINHRSEMRKEAEPLIIAGGATPTLNPKPLLHVVDAVVMGEIEAYEDHLIELLEQGQSKSKMLDSLSNMDGVITLEKLGNADNEPRRHAKRLDDYQTQTIIHSSKAHFGNMHLIEVQRGCPRSCRFCATPAIYGKPRMRSADSVLRMVDEGITYRKKMGLIGADIMSHPDFERIGRTIHSKGATFSLSSVRVDALDEARARLLFDSGHRSIALGVESGSIRLRQKIGKGISDDMVLESAGILAKTGITNLRLYYMIGLPGEADEDVLAIAELSTKVLNVIRKYAPRSQRNTSCDLTITPFIPKPGTPFFKERFADQDELKRKIKTLRKLLGKKKGIALRADSIVDALVENFLANAGENAVEFLEDAHRLGSARKALAFNISKSEYRNSHCNIRA